MGIAATVQQTGGGLFGAFKLTADDTTRPPKHRACLESPQSSRRPRGQGGPSMTGGRNHGIIELDPTGSFVAWQQDVLLRHVERR